MNGLDEESNGQLPRPLKPRRLGDRSRASRILLVRPEELSAPSEPPKVSDKVLEWAKVLVAPLATVVVTGVVGSYVSTLLNEKDARETNERLYAQLLTQREQSDTLIRKDMFSVVINRFLLDSNKQDWGDKVLQLELLAHNFNQSLDLAPLFKDVSYKLASASDVTEVSRIDLQRRLDQTASALNLKQITSLARRGVAREQKISPGNLDGASEPTMIQVTTPLDQFVPNRTATLIARKEQIAFSVEVLRSDLARKELEVRLVMQKAGEQEPLVDQHFWIGRYDFPMLSNVQLPFGLRAAVAVTVFDVPALVGDQKLDSFAQLYLIVFPSSSASFKERQDYDDILMNMVRQRQQTSLNGEIPR